MGLTKPRAYQIFDIDYKQAVRVITLTNVTLSGGAPSTVDGVSLGLGSRILVAGQSTGSQNGVYQVSVLGTGSNGTWIRSIDTNESGELNAGTIVMVTEGTEYKDTQWKLITNDPITIGVTALVFEQNSAFAFGNIYANSTAVLADVVGDTVTFTPANNLVILANATSDTVTFAVSQSPDFTGNFVVSGTVGSNLIPTANVTYNLGNTTNRWNDIYLANSTIYLGNSQISANATSLILTTPQGSQVAFSGTTANISAGTITATGNANVGNLGTAGQITATGNITGGNINLSGNIVDTGALFLITGSSGNVTLAPNGTNVVVATTTGANISGTLGATGNITGGNLSGTLLTGTLTTAAQPNVTSVGTLTSLSASGNVSGGNLITTGTVSTGTLTASGNVTIAGNLTVSGNVISVNVTNLNVVDPIIGLGRGANNTPLTSNDGKDRGQELWYYTTTEQAAFMGYDNSAGKLIAATNVSVSNDVVTVNNYGNLIVGGLESTTISATGNANVGNLGATTVTATTLTGTIGTAAQTNITSVGTLTSLAVTGNVTSGNFVGTLNGSGANVSSISADNISSGTLAQARLANAAVTLGSTALTLGATVTTVAGLTSVTSTTFVGALTGAATTAGTVTTAAQPNITSVGTLSSLTVTGNVSGGNLTTDAQIVATGNITGGNITTGAQVVATGNVTGGNLTTAGRVDSTGNITGGNVAGATGAFTNVSGTLTTAAQPNITSVGTLGSLAVTGNATSGNFIGTLNGSGANVTAISADNISSGTLAQARLANASVTLGSTALTLGSTVTTVAGLSSVTSTTFVGALTGDATTAGTVTTAAQPNITSVGTLTSVTVTGNVAGGNLTTAGLVSAGTTITATGNVSGGNLTTTGQVAATGNVSGGNLVTAGLVSAGTTITATGNVTGGNLTTAGLISAGTTITATGNVAGGNITTAGRVDATGNVSGGNLTTAGVVTATGNVTGAMIKASSNVEIQNRGILFLNDSDNSNYIGLRSPATLTGNFTYIFPTGYGNAAQVLTTNGAGGLTWEDQSGEGGGGATSFPNSTVSPVPGSTGNFDLSFNFVQTVQETPFESSATDPFGVNLGEVYSMMDPVGEVLEGVDLGVLT